MTVIEPMYNRVVMKRIKTKTSAGGLIMAPSGQKSADRATVVAVGPGILDRDTGKFLPVSLVAGDVVLINPYLGMSATIDGEEVLIQKDEEILGKEVAPKSGEING